VTEPSDPFEDEGLPDPAAPEPEQLATGQAEGTMEPPHDTPLAVDEYGTTPAEMREGEPLDGRLAREEPDVLAAADTPADESVDQPPVGRLVDPDEGLGPDTEKDMVASDVGTDLGGKTAEEAAMHVEPEA
jgi:hypothetical protein